MFEEGEFIIYKLWKYIGEVPIKNFNKQIPMLKTQDNKTHMTQTIAITALQ